LAIVGGLVWFFMRKRKQNTSHEAMSQAMNTPFPQYHNGNEHVASYFGKPAMAPHEVEGQQTQISELGSGREVAELPAQGPDKPGPVYK
jgi:hypothetical protein